MSAVNLFTDSSISAINPFNKHPYQQSTYQQVTEGAGGRGEALIYIFFFASAHLTSRGKLPCVGLGSYTLYIFKTCDFISLVIEHKVVMGIGVRVYV